jgi:NAD(P)-dependent dehydrogenase (short-subunit alcohol dehydrogenase family)
MKTILVTGGNRGIGFEVCRQLDRMGHRVLLGSRDEQKGKHSAESLSSNTTVVQLDVSDPESIHGSAQRISEQVGRLDVLINNAGLGTSFTDRKHTSMDGVRKVVRKHLGGLARSVHKLRQRSGSGGSASSSYRVDTVPLDGVKELMETNLYGPWQMIQEFLPLLRKSEDGRIINVSSGLGELKSLTGEHAAYSLSKTSLNALTLMFSNTLREEGIRVNAVCPGWVRTDMGGPNAPRDVAQGADTIVWLATEKEIPTGKFFRDREIIQW